MSDPSGPTAAQALAAWVHALPEPSPDDLALAESSLVDTVAVGVAARGHHVVEVSRGLPDVARWAALCHVIDFDDLHMPSTTHISTVCVPVALATGGGAQSYLAGAGVMARVGTLLGWRHYVAGWHTTTTAGAFGAAAAAAVAAGLGEEATAHALALVVPAAGGLQRAFGTDGKSLQVGLAADAGVRAALLAGQGARADLGALDAWLLLMGAQPADLDVRGPVLPDGLAVKMYPACYALQRPLSAVGALHGSGLDPGAVTRVVVRTTSAAVQPLIHHRPQDGLQGKFSLEYAVAAALLDEHPGLNSFSDEAVRRPQAQRLVGLVEVDLDSGGEHLMDQDLVIEVHTDVGVQQANLELPPGHPGRPATQAQLDDKISDCLDGTELKRANLTWESSASVLRQVCEPTP